MNHSVRRVNALAKQLDACRYLEIGVRDGNTFLEVVVPERTAVDPVFKFNTAVVRNEQTRCAETASDSFFAAEPMLPPYDIVFIDGLHTFEQVVRDFSNVVLRTGQHSVILIDDTIPSDVYSALPDEPAALRYREAAGSKNRAWHGDVFKVVFYIHDFWPSLNYRTMVGSGNAQTLVWRANGLSRAPRFNDLERISRLTYFDLQANFDVMQAVTESEATSLCVAEIKGL